MKRERSQFLESWFHSPQRKPLVIRGARQVGKTWIIRHFAETNGLRLVELNFEKRPELESLFSSNDPKETLLHLSAFKKETIIPKTSLLFLDEIQVAPHLLAKLRWFEEEMPELPIIAAGSLLDFALAKHAFSMPVGRISYMYLEPLSFVEFLDALQESQLKELIKQFDFSFEIPKALHLELIKRLKEYLIVGGMPSAVSSWREERDPNKVSQIHFDLMATYREDFAKYSGRLALQHLNEVMLSIPRQLGRKFVYSHVNPNSKTESTKQAIELLSMARICHPVQSTAANGLPLGAEVNDKFFKMILLDIGISSAMLGLTISEINSLDDLTLVNSGGLTEQFVGQELRTIFPPFAPPALYYWQRREAGSDAEVDYIIQHENRVVPIEVKSGSSGKLKSLHEFMKEKKKEVAVRINSASPNKHLVKAKDKTGKEIEFALLSIPLYLVSELHRLLKLL